MKSAWTKQIRVKTSSTPNEYTFVINGVMNKLQIERQHFLIRIYFEHKRHFFHLINIIYKQLCHFVWSIDS